MTDDAAPLPRPARWLGLAGLLPFLAAALVAVAGGPEPRPWAIAALAAYGAVILSFLGAVHWGLALAAPGAAPQVTAGRLGLGVVPALIGWAALLLPAPAGLPVLAGAILAVAAVETAAAARARTGLVPLGYLRLRWVLSLGAAACLLAGAAVA